MALRAVLPARAHIKLSVETQLPDLSDPTSARPADLSQVTGGAVKTASPDRTSYNRFGFLLPSPVLPRTIDFPSRRRCRFINLAIGSFIRNPLCGNPTLKSGGDYLVHRTHSLPRSPAKISSGTYSAHWTVPPIRIWFDASETLSLISPSVRFRCFLATVTLYRMFGKMSIVFSKIFEKFLCTSSTKFPI